jgi:hypothetical protein
MSSDLKDFRGEITRETDVWLETEERVHGRSRQSVVRELLHAHAMKRLHESKVMTELAAAHGVLPEEAGTSRHPTARGGRR